ncbi:hypothetical protein AURUGA1_01337 [Aurantimicrobium sp. MWH-Uga1]|nr:hypothetical protein AURUGA1_01337 [Aurantimicrobium sp. MWH-Uga1]
MVLPVIILILGICLQAIAALGTQLSNASLARQAAQELARGVDGALVSRALHSANSKALFRQSAESDVICVTLQQNIGPGPLEWIVPQIRVRECVLDAH